MAEMPKTEPAAGGFDAYIDAASALLGIPLDPAWVAAVGANLTVLQSAAGLVAGFPLPDEAEPAPVFTA
ncbi:DUF4089 domain-containing protein [Methylobacterium sp. E-045]|jgi:hypothetical protein|uniref:DUF4089 domain-containing protein n=1 Tax=Methylobacterium sp. E-045 TaxID=2836575 RepID=UPI001FB8C680|nr:DUF4089 domain-containing protein [Methylobacterium sp. E-045]MCJ2129829.1 DUF4089 domain-containing protein [Methylobacterium sp. E-045]